MKIHSSAFKHGIEEHDIIAAASAPAREGDLGEDSPARQLRLGFATAAHRIELNVPFESGMT